MKITIYTDGGCRPNPGPGGWGVVLLYPGREPEELSGAEEKTTNNRMELQAAIEAMRALDEPHEIDLHTDSQYLRKGMSSWIEGWKRRGWKTASGAPVQNADLWRQLEAEIERHVVQWFWTRGHSGDRWNERADELASAAIPRDIELVDEPGAALVVLAVAYSGKKKRGAWAALLRFGEFEKDLSGVIEGGTANQMHIVGAIRALEAFHRRVRMHVYTTSDYLKDGASSWLGAWRARGWKTREGKQVSHRDAWQLLERQVGRHQIVWHVLGSGDDVEEMVGVKRAARAALVGDLTEGRPVDEEEAGQTR